VKSIFQEQLTISQYTVLMASGDRICVLFVYSGTELSTCPGHTLPIL